MHKALKQYFLKLPDGSTLKIKAEFTWPTTVSRKHLVLKVQLYAALLLVSFT